MTTTAYKDLQQQPLEEQLYQLQRQLREMHLESERNKQRIEKLSCIVLEREKKICELQHYEYCYRKGNERKHAAHTFEEKYQKQVNDLQNDKDRLSNELTESQQHTAQLERVIRFLRERQEEAHLEAKQFQEEFHKAQGTIAEYGGKLHDADCIRQELNEHIQQEQQAKREAMEEVQALYVQFDILKKMLSEAQAQCDNACAAKQEVASSLETLQLDTNKRNDELDKLMAHKDEQIIHYKQKLEAVEARYQQAVTEQQRQLEEIHGAHTTQSEIESRLKMAQQHLAKKVKETAELNDKVSVQGVAMLELQNALEQLHIHATEQQLSFETQLQQEKRVQEELLEVSRSADASVRQLEERYYHTYEKLQHCERRIQELQEIEEKYAQLQALFANIGGFFGAPMSYNHPTAVHGNHLAPNTINKYDPHLPASEQQESKRPYQDLFDIPMNGIQRNNSIFD